ncbi:bcl-2-binding component 3-like [Mus caroli]|uniref:Bcl-2-binding component 3-like n=1 Tax=Mus caroli TaxID=10089 RepID=A0A6P5QRC4_MUSCR|nr:bcl-2-binding component 3-like [Mus caroli]
MKLLSLVKLKKAPSGGILRKHQAYAESSKEGARGVGSRRLRRIPSRKAQARPCCAGAKARCPRVRLDSASPRLRAREKHRRGPQRGRAEQEAARAPGKRSPGSALLPLRSSRPPPHWELRAARPREAGAGREGPRSPPPAASAAPSQGHRQPSWRRADAEPLPRGRHRGRSPSPLRLPRPWGASGAGPAFAPPSPRPSPPTSLRLRPPDGGLHAESVTQRPRGAGRTLHGGAAPHTCSPPTGPAYAFQSGQRPRRPFGFSVLSLTPLVAASARSRCGLLFH